MSKEHKWVRSISFNKKDKKDQERLKLIGRKSFSRYIKKLLDEEIKRQEIVEEKAATTQEPTEESDPEEQTQKPSTNKETSQKRSQHSHRNKYSHYYQNNQQKPLIAEKQKAPQPTQPKRYI